MMRGRNDYSRRFFFVQRMTSVDAPTAGHAKALSLGALVTEGKTKKIYRINGSDLVSVVAKDDITAGDGAKHDVIPDKGRLATATTCNVFRLLKAVRHPGRLRGAEQRDLVHRSALHDAALRGGGAARGARLGAESSPHYSKGQLFPKHLVEFYLKTRTRTGRASRSSPTTRSCSTRTAAPQIKLFNPAKPFSAPEPF
jgi:phosphoribosylaminoimidazole-succinocarboxamide synthase